MVVLKMRSRHHNMTPIEREREHATETKKRIIIIVISSNNTGYLLSCNITLYFVFECSKERERESVRTRV
jgi:hypothetical protein